MFKAERWTCAKSGMRGSMINLYNWSRSKCLGHRVDEMVGRYKEAKNVKRWCQTGKQEQGDTVSSRRVKGSEFIPKDEEDVKMFFVELRHFHFWEMALAIVIIGETWKEPEPGRYWVDREMWLIRLREGEGEPLDWMVPLVTSWGRWSLASLICKLG